MKKKYLYIVFIYFLTLLMNAQFSKKFNNKKLDSLLLELKKDQADTNLAKINYKIGNILAHRENPDTSIYYFKNAIEIASKSNFENILVRSYNQIANLYFDKGEMDSCRDYYLIALSHISSDHQDYFDVYSGLGTLYFYKGDNVKSYEYSLKSLKLAEMSGKPNWIARAYGNIGVALKEQMKLDDALVFFKKTLDIAIKNKLEAQTYVSLTNIGNIYSDKFTRSKSRYDIESALNYYLQAKAIVMQFINDKKDRSNAVTLLGNIGSTYADLHDYEKALSTFKEALELMGDDVFFGSKSMLYNNLATIYIEMKNAPEAGKYLKLAKQSAIESQSPSDLMENYRGYALYSELMNDYKNAYLYEYRYKAISDSLFSTEVAEKRKEIELNAEFAKKEAIEKEQQEKKEALAKEEKQRQLLLRNTLIFGFVLMFFVAFLIFRSYRQKQKANEIITEQKKEVERQKELVEEKQKAILDSIHYAKRIQQSLLPTNKYIDRNINKLKDNT